MKRSTLRLALLALVPFQAGVREGPPADGGSPAAALRPDRSPPLSGALVREAPAGRPPTISSSLPARATVYMRSRVRFTLTVDEPDGDLVTLRLLNPPPGMVLPPVEGAQPPVTVEADWTLTDAQAGLRRLWFEARAAGQTRRLVREVLVTGFGDGCPMLITDFDADGALDTLVRASLANRLGKVDTGAIYCWKGTTTPSGAPTAILRDPDADHFDRLGGASGQAFQLVDVTGDGRLDLVAAVSSADRGGVTDVGEIHVWAAGTAWVGEVPPTTKLYVPGAPQGSRLANGSVTDGTSVLFGDVTGDGVADVVSTDETGAEVTGSLYVWAGGAAMAAGGELAPSATLVAPTLGGDPLGKGGGQGVRLAEVTGDAYLDVIACASQADDGDKPKTGAIFVWAGGPGMAGMREPRATLRDPNAAAGDELTWAGLRMARLNGHYEGLQLLDLTGDGVLDLFAIAIRADVAGAVNAGALYVFHGGSSLAGAVAPAAKLTAPAPQDHEELGNGVLAATHFADVDGDAALDLLAGSQWRDAFGVPSAGAIFVWSDVGSLTGDAEANRTLAVPTAEPLDRLTWADPHGILLADATGDGQVDVVGATSLADVNGVVDAGAVYVWHGGAGLAGTGERAPDATLTVSGAAASDFLALNYGSALNARDVSGDGVLDLVVAASLADAGGVQDTGAIYVWEGGGSLAGSLTESAALSVPGAKRKDWLARGSVNRGLLFADVTGDGVEDIVAVTPSADRSAVDEGAVYLWEGGALSGSSPPHATLAVAGTDRLGDCGAMGVLFADLTRDGVLDVVVGASRSNDLFLWHGGPDVGSGAPEVIFDVPGIQPGEFLGIFGLFQGLAAADADADGELELLAGSSLFDAAKTDSGALFVWDVEPGTGGSPAPTTTHLDPDAQVDDQLGR